MLSFKPAFFIILFHLHKKLLAFCHRSYRKGHLVRVKEELEKAYVGLKFSIQKTNIMASSAITSWQIEEEKVEAVKFYFLGLQNHCVR